MIYRVSALLFCLGCAMGSLACRDEQAAPKKSGATELWTGHPGILGQWGNTSDGIFGILSQPNTTKDTLVVRQWQGDRLTEMPLKLIPYSLDALPLSNGFIGGRFERSEDRWFTGIVEVQTGAIVTELQPPHGWSFEKPGRSPNGKLLAFFASGAGDELGRVAVVDVASQKLSWVADLNGHGAGTVRTIVVTDDGRYVAVAGWDNGTAMIDAVAGKLLWAKRPPNEVGSSYAVFALDGETIYTAGSEGCVYVIDTQTGDILNQLWASKDGKSSYGHRVSALALSNDGKWLAAGTGPGGETYIWNLANLSKVSVFRHGGGSIEIVSFSPDSKHLATVGNGEIKVWSLPALATEDDRSGADNIAAP